MRDICCTHVVILSYFPEQGQNYPPHPPSTTSRMSSKDSDQSDVFPEGACHFLVCIK